MCQEQVSIKAYIPITIMDVLMALEITLDIAVGRLSVTTASQALGVVNKIISYEDFGNYSAYSTAGGLHCAEFSDYDPRDSYEDRRFVRTSEDIITGMTGIGKSVQRIYNYNHRTEPLRLLSLCIGIKKIFLMEN